MLGKNNFHLRRLREGEKVTHYAIKKLSVGVASVAVGSFILFGSSNAQAAQVVASQASSSAPEASLTHDLIDEDTASDRDIE